MLKKPLQIPLIIQNSVELTGKKLQYFLFFRKFRQIDEFLASGVAMVHLKSIAKILCKNPLQKTFAKSGPRHFDGKNSTKTLFWRKNRGCIENFTKIVYLVNYIEIDIFSSIRSCKCCNLDNFNLEELKTLAKIKIKSLWLSKLVLLGTPKIDFT